MGKSTPKRTLCGRCGQWHLLVRLQPSEGKFYWCPDAGRYFLWRSARVQTTTA